MSSAATATLDPVLLDCKDVAEDLHRFLQGLDPSGWRQDIESATRRELERLHARLTEVASAVERAHVVDGAVLRVRESVRACLALVEENWPRADATGRQVRKEWLRLRARLQPGYASMAEGLARLRLAVPSLRPTNYGRNLFHFTAAAASIVLLQNILGPTPSIYASGGFAAMCWTMEIARRRIPGVTTFWMRFMGGIAHPHEHYAVNSATWYATGVALLAALFSPLASTIALAVLAVGDPAAGIVGRRWGRHRLVPGKSIEGSAAFLVAGFGAAILATFVYYPAARPAAVILCAAAASLCGGAAEALSTKIDDNVTVPVAAAVGASLALMLVG